MTRTHQFARRVARQAEGVPESVLFEVADFALCQQLCKRLDQDWQARLVGRTESHFVAVGMDPADGRMVLLLDAVAEWASEVGLSSVTFHVGEQMSVVFAKERDGSGL
jgi:hypothetical protein